MGSGRVELPPHSYQTGSRLRILTLHDKVLRVTDDPPNRLATISPTSEEAMNTNKTAYRSAVRIVLAAAFILLLPLLAMQITNEVVWSVGDFAVAGSLLVGTGLVYELAARKAGNAGHRSAVGVAALAVLLLVWLSLAVGIIGVEGDPADLMYVGVIAVGIIGAIIARLQPHGMARALFAMALAQALVVVIALIAGKQNSPSSSVTEIVGVNTMFIALFLGSAWLFRYSVREQLPVG